MEENQSSLQIYMIRQNKECVMTEEKTNKRNQHEYSWSNNWFKNPRGKAGEDVG